MRPPKKHAPAAKKKKGAGNQSCGLSRAVIRELQSRELTAEDYEILLRLDESVPKRDVLSAEQASQLIDSTLEADAECSVCLCDCHSGEAAVVLACGHVFHAPCLKAWAMKGRNSCPMCNEPVAQPA